MTLGGHGPGDFTLCKIDDRDLLGIRHIDESSRAAVVDLESFRVSFKAGLGDLRPGVGVDNGERALPIPDDDTAARYVEPNVISVITKVYPCKPGQIFRPQDVHRAIHPARYIDGIR